MKVLYLDCGMGAAGDMLAAALMEIVPDAEEVLKELNSLGIPGVQIKKEASVKCGIAGTHMSVTVNGEEETSHDHHEEAHSHSHGHHHEEAHSHSHGHHHEEAYSHGHTHHHTSMYDIEHLVMEHLKLSEKIKKDIMAVYRLIAEAESHAHGVPVTEIHFHEVGTMDAVADIAAVCILMDKISPDEVVVSPVHVGSGQVRCAHGILPVPAPATAYILKDVPVYGGRIRGELCTPTGAALLKHFAARFGNMPVIKVKAIGYGMGKKDFEAANCVRALLGEAENEADTIIELSCNVDDMTAEQVGFAMECLFDAGAREVYTTPVGMKKSRPGILIRVMCTQEDKEKMLGLLFRHTTTLGIRENIMNRYVLNRRIETVHTPFGDVRCKYSSGYGVSRSKYEYDDLARIAKEKGISIEEIKKMLED